MKLEDIVTSLELSNRLKELNVPQKSFFCYQPIENEKPSVWPRRFNLNEFAHSSEDERIAAYTAGELGEIIPNFIHKPNESPFDIFRLVIRKFIYVESKLTKMNNYIINYEGDTTEVSDTESFLLRKLSKNFYDVNLANAIAKMLIHLLENELIEV